MMEMLGFLPGSIAAVSMGVRIVMFFLRVSPAQSRRVGKVPQRWPIAAHGAIDERMRSRTSYQRTTRPITTSAPGFFIAPPSS